MAPVPPVNGVHEPEGVRGLEIGEGDILPLKCGGDLEFSRGLPIGETGHEIFLAMWRSLDTGTNQTKRQSVN